MYTVICARNDELIAAKVYGKTDSMKTRNYSCGYSYAALSIKDVSQNKTMFGCASHPIRTYIYVLCDAKIKIKFHFPLPVSDCTRNSIEFH